MLGTMLHIPLISALPFVALLGTIAVAPLVAPHWWHSNRNKAIVAALLALPILIELGILAGANGRAILAEKAHEYLSFIVVIGALFVISEPATGRIAMEG